MSERKMATVQCIDDITPIEGADAIETAHIGGWTVVIRKGEFSKNEMIVFCEIDSWIPHKLAPFLTKGKEPREYLGVPGERLRTVRLRKQLSQGLILPLSVLPVALYHAGKDVSERLGIVKYEPPMPAELAGIARGNFPSFIPKTDQERVQNLSKSLVDWVAQDLRWEVTEKLDGSSMTVYYNNGEFGVCSRNLDLVESADNAFWKAANALNLREKLEYYKLNFAIQGELIGEGIQGNKYNLKGTKFMVYDIWAIDEQKYLTSIERRAISQGLALDHVPVFIYFMWLLTPSIDDILKAAEGESKLAPIENEGLVFKCITNPDLSFKAISNKFLEKNKE
jgi:RNA ligase (TIGR02306 family)